MSAYRSKITCPEKDWARSIGYVVIKRLNKLYNHWHIVIASQDCGDIHLLHKWKQHRVIACDLDFEARLQAMRLRDVVLSPHDDIYDTLCWAINEGYKLGSINVDLCFSLINGLPILKKILAIAPCPVIFTYCRREGKTGPQVLGYTPPETPARVQKLREKLMFKTLGIKPIIHELYESDTEEEHGNHMAVCVYVPKKKKNQ